MPYTVTFRNLRNLGLHGPDFKLEIEIYVTSISRGEFREALRNVVFGARGTKMV